MAGAGYKLFQTGDVLTAAQVNTYLNEQTVMVFANAAARTSALTSVLAEGMMSYLQDTNSVEVYNGSSWVNVGNAGDITEVQAGVGISIASGTGPIPVITNSSTDLITTAGDILYGTAADTVARLGIGTAGQVLKVNSGATAPEWGAAAGGGMTLLSTTSLTGASTTISGISGSYKKLIAFIYGVTNATANGVFRVAPNNNTTGSSYVSIDSVGASFVNSVNRVTQINFGTTAYARTDANNAATLIIDNYANSTNYKPFNFYGFAGETGGSVMSFNAGGAFVSNTAISSLVFSNAGGDLSTGTVLLYGVN